jgi:hypothetical protein
VAQWFRSGCPTARRWAAGATSSGDVASLGYPVTFLGSGCKTKPKRAPAGLKDPGFGGA